MNDEPLNEFVPAETQLRHVLIENGKLEAYNQELLEQVKQLQSTQSLKLRDLELKLAEKNKKLKEKGNYDESHELKRLRGFLLFLAEKYEIDLNNEKMEYLK